MSSGIQTKASEEFVNVYIVFHSEQYRHITDTSLRILNYLTYNIMGNKSSGASKMTQIVFFLKSMPQNGLNLKCQSSVFRRNYKIQQNIWKIWYTNIKLAVLLQIYRHKCHIIFDLLYQISWQVVFFLIWSCFCS